MKTPSAKTSGTDVSTPRDAQFPLDTSQLAEHIARSLHSMSEKRKQSSQASPVKKKAARKNGTGRDILLDGNPDESRRHGRRKSRHTFESPGDNDGMSEMSTSKDPPAEPPFHTWLQLNEERNVLPHPLSHMMLRREPSSSTSTFDRPPNHLQDLRLQS